MKEILEQILKGLVGDEKEIKINEIKGEKLVIYEITVDKQDLGKIIGKKGAIITSLRKIFSSIGKRLGKTVIINLVEDFSVRREKDEKTK
jgi:predicted RNA-binding protein YlqC (UPF0109 family)